MDCRWLKWQENRATVVLSIPQARYLVRVASLTPVNSVWQTDSAFSQLGGTEMSYEVLPVALPALATTWLLSFFLGTYSAAERGRGKGCGILFWLPVLGPVAIIILVKVPPDHDSLKVEIEEKGLKSKNWKSCQLCRETVRSDALRCRYCGFLFEPYRVMKINEYYHCKDQEQIEKDRQAAVEAATQQSEEEHEATTQQAIGERNAGEVAKVEEMIRSRMSKEKRSWQ